MSRPNATESQIATKVEDLCVGAGGLLNSPSMAFSTSLMRKRGFRMAPVLNGLQPSEVPADGH